MQNILQKTKAMAVDEFGGFDKLTLHTLTHTYGRCGRSFDSH